MNDRKLLIVIWSFLLTSKKILLIQLVLIKLLLNGMKNMLPNYVQDTYSYLKNKILHNF